MVESIIEQLRSEVRKLLAEMITKKTDDEIMEYLGKALSEKESNQEEIDMPASENIKPYDERILRSVKLQDGTIIAKMLSPQPEELKYKGMAIKKAEENMRNFHKKESSDLNEWSDFLVKMNIPFKVVEDTEYDETIDNEVDVYRLDIGVITTLEDDMKLPEFRKFYEMYTEYVCIFFNKDGSFRYFSALSD